MAIEHLRIGERRRFTTLETVVAEDARLSFRALGVLTYLLGKPPHWVVNMRELERSHSEGREALRKALAELEAAGYAERRRWNDPETGRFASEIVIREQSPTNPAAGSYPQGEATKPQVGTSDGNPSTGNRRRVTGDGKPSPSNHSRAITDEGHRPAVSDARAEMARSLLSDPSDHLVAEAAAVLELLEQRAGRPALLELVDELDADGVRLPWPSHLAGPAVTERLDAISARRRREALERQQAAALDVAREAPGSADVSELLADARHAIRRGRSPATDDGRVTPEAPGDNADTLPGHGGR